MTRPRNRHDLLWRHVQAKRAIPTSFKKKGEEMYVAPDASC